MSRIRVFGLDGYIEGELVGRLSRGAAIVGSADVRGGGQSTLEISAADASKSFLQFGRLVLVEQQDLPAWAGMIDPEWTAYGTPSLTVYNIEYLLSQREPDNVATYTEPTASSIQRLIRIGNGQEDMGLRAGVMADNRERSTTIDRRTIWEQMKEIVARADMELAFRPEVVHGRLLIYVDLAKRLGLDTNFLFHDGDGANMVVDSAKVTGEIANRVIGINDAFNEEDRLQTDAYVDEESIAHYRLRSKVMQFSGTTEQNALDEQAKAYLAAHSRPVLSMTVRVLDVGEAFANVRLGNSAIFHAANLRRNGGVHGYQGTARLLAWAYDEPSSTLGATVVGSL